MGGYDLAHATDNRTLTRTTQSQTVFTNNNDCSQFSGFGCTGNAATGGITVGINGGSLNFNICRGGMGNFNFGTPNNDLDPSCRVTPPTIPPGADTQVGTGLNPIIVNDAGVSNVPFGGPTNDRVPVGSSNVAISSFLVHGPTPGETTLNCTSTATCGTQISQLTLTHWQLFQSNPAPIVGDPLRRQNHIEFSVDQPMTWPFNSQRPFKINWTIDSTTDSNGNLVPGTATGSFTVTCGPSFECANTSGTFHVNTTTFSLTSTGFVTIDSVTGGGGFGGCSAGTLVDPFHANGVSCQSR